MRVRVQANEQKKKRVRSIESRVRKEASLRLLCFVAENKKVRVFCKKESKRNQQSSIIKTLNQHKKTDREICRIAVTRDHNKAVVEVLTLSLFVVSCLLSHLVDNI